MTLLDTELTELADWINALPKRSLVALFWACSSALAPEFQVWAARRGERTEPILREALAAARQFAASGTEPAGDESLLLALEAAIPAGDSPDEVSSTSAQDCWICADVAIRVLVDPRYNPGPAIEFALEPVLSSATEQLFGVSQLGSSDEEDAQLRRVLQHPKVAAAIEFCRWATDFLRSRPTPTEADLSLVSARASALAP